MLIIKLMLSFSVYLQIQVYSGITNQVKKTISRFKEVAYSGCFRHDGKLLAAGSEVGVVKVTITAAGYVNRIFLETVIIYLGIPPTICDNRLCIGTSTTLYWLCIHR